MTHHAWDQDSLQQEDFISVPDSWPDDAMYSCLAKLLDSQDTSTLIHPGGTPPPPPHASPRQVPHLAPEVSLPPWDQPPLPQVLSDTVYQKVPDHLLQGLQQPQDLYQWSQVLQGSQDFPQGLHGSQGLPQGSQALPQGSQALPQGSQALPQGSQALPQGSQALPQGSQALPQGSQALSQGSQAFPQGSQALPQGSPVPWSLHQLSQALQETPVVLQVPQGFQQEVPGGSPLPSLPMDTLQEVPLFPQTSSPALQTGVRRGRHASQTKRTKLYERTDKFDDPAKEKKRIDAINSKRNRDKRAADLTALRLKVNSYTTQRDNLLREVQGLRQRETDLLQQLIVRPAQYTLPHTPVTSSPPHPVTPSPPPYHAHHITLTPPHTPHYSYSHSPSHSHSSINY